MGVTAGVDSGLPGDGRDCAHRFPGLLGWGEKAAAAMAFERWDEALLYRTLMVLPVNAPTIADVDELVDRSAAGVSRHSRGRCTRAAR